MSSAFQPRREDLLTAQEARQLQAADRGDLPCPRCGQALMGAKIIDEAYQGVILFCPDLSGCGFREC